MNSLLKLIEAQHQSHLKDIAIYKSILYKLTELCPSPETQSIIEHALQNECINIPERTTDSTTFLKNLIKDNF